MVKLTMLPGFPSYIWNVKSQTVRKDGPMEREGTKREYERVGK